MTITNFLRSNVGLTEIEQRTRLGLIVRKPLLSLAALFLAVSMLAPSIASAQMGFDEKAVAKFYNGKTIRIIVGFPAGGSFDVTARIVARYMGKYIPGNPNIIVENIVGAGTMVALNKVYNTLPKDGTIIAAILGGTIMNQLFGNPAARFDARKLRIFTAPAPIVHMLVVTKKSGVTKLSELMGPNSAKKIKIGATSMGTSVANSAFLAKQLVGLNYDIVTGYRGWPKVKLAMEQGEVNASFNNINELMGMYRDKIDSGEWLILAQSSVKSHPRAPDVPVLGNMAKTEEDRRMHLLGAVIPMRFAFMYALAPGVPEDRANALEQAHEKTLANKSFAADMVKAGLVVDPVPAKDMRKMVADILNMPEKIKARLATVMQAGGRRKAK